jgi:hypothetical protein
MAYLKFSAAPCIEDDARLDVHLGGDRDDRDPELGGRMHRGDLLANDATDLGGDESWTCTSEDISADLCDGGGGRRDVVADEQGKTAIDRLAKDRSLRRLHSSA